MGWPFLDPRGGLYTQANIGERLAVRNMLDQLRGSGHIGGGPSNFGPKDRQAFANQLDRWMAKLKRAFNSLTKHQHRVAHLERRIRQMETP